VAEAKQAAKEIYRIDPDFSLEKYRGGGMVFQFYDKEIERQFLDSLQKVGLK